MQHKERHPFTFMKLRRQYTEPHSLYHTLRTHQPLHFDETSQACFASLISLFTIAQVLGIPTDDQAELHRLERWSDTFGDVSSGYLAGNSDQHS